MYRDFKRDVPLKSALSLLVLTNMVFTTIQPCVARQHPQRVVISEKPSLDLIEKLGHQPELITPEYLYYVLGRPAKRNVADGSNTTYHWLTNEGGIGTQDCELTQTLDANKRIVRASFKMNLPRSTVTLVDIEKKISDDRNAAAAAQSGQGPGQWQAPTQSGQPGGSSATGSQFPGANSSQFPAPTNSQFPAATANNQSGNSSALPPEIGRKLFDQECRPSLQYSFVPHTTVLYTQAANTFHVHRAQIDYVGPPLPPPSQQDLAEVATGMRTRAFAHNAADKHGLAVPMLNDHLTANPSDAEAHYALGVSYQKASQLNDAIAEYQLALRYSNGNSVVANNAVQSLQQLHVLQSPDDRIDFHTLKFKQNGQGLTEGDVIATQDRQSLLGNRSPYGTSPINSVYNPGMSGSPGYGMNGAASTTSPASYQPNAPAIAAPSFSNNSQLVGLKAPPAGSLNAPTSPTATGLRPPISSTSSGSASQRVRYTPYNSTTNTPGNSGASTQASAANSFSGQPSFYDSMQYGSNLFPATAPSLNLEPGF
jgi:tetratricopeptide (TPR) repeat protein